MPRADPVARPALPDTPPHLQAKFLPPRPRQALSRPRLHELLSDAAPARALWLQGQAGAGKSTLAAAWAADSGRPLAWFRVDATDLDIGAACEALARLLAMRTRRRLPPAMLQAPPRGDDQALQVHARHFFRAFHALCGPLVLVFDDVHTAPSTGFQTLLQAALDEAPATSTLLMTSRHPPQGVLLDAVARGDLWVMDGHALNFTADEAQALLAPRIGAEQAQKLHARTGGWVAGLTLFAARPSSTDEAEQLVASFFSQRVLGVLDAPQRQLLAAVSLLPEVDDATLQALGLGADAADQLDRLCQQLGFVQRLRPGRRCWRLHDLLTESVQAHWPEVGSPAWRQATLQAAAAVRAQQGHLQAALALLMRAGLADLAQHTWREHAPALLRRGRAQELQRAFAELDPMRAGTDATALTQRGLAAWLAQDPDTGDWLDRAWAAQDAAGLPPASAARLLTSSAALNAQFSGWRSYVGREDWLQRFLAAWHLRSELADADAGMRADKSALLVFVTHRMAPLPEAERQALIDRVLHTLAQRRPLSTAVDATPLDPSVAVSASSSLVEWCNYRGDRMLLARLADLTLPWLAAPGLAGAAQASWWITYGWVSARLVLGRGDMPEGVAAVERGVAMAQASGAPDVTFYGLTNLVAAALSRHDLALAQVRLQQMQEAAAQRTGAPEQPTQQATLHVLAARVLTLRGDAATALVRMNRALELARASEFPVSEMWVYHLSHVQVLTALGREDEAVALAAHEALAYEGMRHEQLQALALLARCAKAWREGRTADAGDVRACVQTAARHSWHAVGNFLHDRVAHLAAAALALGVERDFVQQMVRQRRLQAPDPDAADWPWPLRVHALGGFEVWCDGQALDFGARPQKKPLDLLRLLVARGPAPLDTATVCDALWPDAEGDRAKASLDMAVLRLRKLLGHDDALRLDNAHLSLNRQWVWVDSWAWAAGQPLPYAGPLFGHAPPELPWAAQRESLHLQFLRRCHAQGGLLEQAGEAGEALALYEAALQQDPLDEALHRGVIRCHLALGEPAAAQRAFARCKRQLQDGLGIAPAPATLALLAVR
jgi:ATP/maltotriose-dependent transcriptional regulator MalT